MQIARTKLGVQTILEHLGSAHDDAQLAALVTIARERIAEMNGQEQLDLDALAPASPPTRIWASSRSSPSVSVMTTTTRIGCSFEAAFAAFMPSRARG